MSLFPGFAAGRIAVPGAEIAYVAGGEGPPLLLLHGYPQTKALWARVAPLLAGRYRVICADLRGYGDSSKPADTPDHAPYAFRAMAADQVALMAALGHRRFHVAGHDRGARTAFRMALDHPQAVASLTLMDIVPTRTLFLEGGPAMGLAYWHWYFLAQPAPFPETLIGAAPDSFFESSLTGWGAARLSDFDPDQLAAYRRAWHDPEAVRGACCDYRAAATLDLDHDAADGDRAVACPVLVLYGRDGAMARLYDVPATWAPRCPALQAEAMPGGHFFVDLAPGAVAERLAAFLNPLQP